MFSLPLRVRQGRGAVIVGVMTEALGEFVCQIFSSRTTHKKTI